MSSAVPQVQITPELMKIINDVLAARASGAVVTFRDLWVRYEAYGSMRTDGGRTKIKGWEIQASHAKRLLAHFGDLPWDKCDLNAADEYRQKRAKDINRRTKLPGVAASTRNREMRSAQACLSFAVRRGVIGRNPLAGMQDEVSVNDRDFAISQDQVILLMKAARPQLRWFLVLLSETGMRKGELLTMEWTEVNMDRGLMTVLAHKAKSGKARTFSLSVNALAVLEMIPADGVNPFVFADHKDPAKHLNEDTLGDWWVYARDVAGVKGPKGQPVWLHTLRHSFATDYVTAGGSIETLMGMCGWSGQAMARRYINISERHHEAARAIIDARGAQVRTAVLGKAIRPKRAPSINASTAVTEDAELTEAAAE